MVLVDLIGDLSVLGKMRSFHCTVSTAVLVAMARVAQMVMRATTTQVLLSMMVRA